MIRLFIERYFGNHTRHEVKELYVATAILASASSLVAIFEPIYLRSLGFSLQTVLLFFAAVYLAELVLYPLGARIAVRIGFEHSMLLASPFLILYYFTLSLLGTSPYFLPLAALFLACQKMFYWPAFHAELATFGTHGERGRELSSVVIIERVIGVVTPALGGILLSRFGSGTTFLVVAILILISNIPLLMTRERRSSERVTYASVWHMLRAPSYRRTFAAFLGYGGETIWYVGWFSFLYGTLRTFERVGFLFSASMAIGAFAILLIGRLIDARMRADGLNGTGTLVRYGTIIAGLVWVFRMMQPRGITLLLLETFDRVTFPLVVMPLRTMSYEIARTSGHPVSVIAASEIMLGAGKVIAAVIGAVVVMFFDPPWTALFVVGLLFTLPFFLVPAGKLVTPIPPGSPHHSP